MLESNEASVPASNVVVESTSFSLNTSNVDETIVANSTSFLPFLETDAQRKAFGFFVFILAGFFEIGGGWLVWQTIREHRPWWMAFLGSLALAIYGFVATLQPINSFGRVYAIYGAFFILLSILWGYLVDGFKPDLGDIIGGAIVVVGTMIMFFWPNR